MADREKLEQKIRELGRRRDSIQEAMAILESENDNLHDDIQDCEEAIDDIVERELADSRDMSEESLTEEEK